MTIMRDDSTRSRDPDELLARVQAEEQQRQARGRLKIFLGYAAGVGKTYAMLEAAHQRRDEGVDVVVGYVETHGRAETEALLADLEVDPAPAGRLPRRTAARDGRGRRAGAPAPARAGGRAGPHQRPRLAPPQALPGCRGAAGRRHRRLHHAEHPAPGEPERRGGADHRRHRARDGARQRAGRGQRDRADRPAAAGAAAAPAGGQGLRARAGCAAPSSSSSARAT